MMRTPNAFAQSPRYTPTHLVVLQLFALLVELVESGVDALEERLRLLPLLFSFLEKSDTLTAPLLVDPEFGRKPSI